MDCRTREVSAFPPNVPSADHASCGSAPFTRHVHPSAAHAPPADEPAPYACGAHPYLCVGEAIDHLELTVPASTRHCSSLVVTVDCGAMAHDALQQAHDAGVDVIVVDHHKCSADLPRTRHRPGEKRGGDTPPRVAPPHREAGVKFLEYLASDAAQTLFAKGNNEWPTVPGVKLANPELESFGKFKTDTLPLANLGKTQATAQRIADKVGWK